MNKRRIVTLFLGIFLGFDLAAFGDGLIKFPTGPAVWTIDVTPSSQQPSATTTKEYVTKIEITQDDKEQRSLVTWSSGRTKESWYVPTMNLIVTENKDGRPFLVSNSGYAGEAFAIPFTAAAFQWLQPQFLQEKDPVSYHGKQCFHYKGSAVPVPAGKVPSPLTRREAWIDSETLFPVALDAGTTLCTYTFSNKPPPPLVMPAKFQTVLGH